MSPLSTHRRNDAASALVGGIVARRLRNTVMAAFACLCVFPLQAGASELRGTDIVISCGGQDTKISAGSELRNIGSIRITVDPANQCRVEASVQFDTGARQARKSRPYAVKPPRPGPRISDLPPSQRRCFLFGGRSYCE
jgi:hypothetical protein